MKKNFLRMNFRDTRIIVRAFVGAWYAEYSNVA
jgi:hypothetical protein